MIDSRQFRMRTHHSPFTTFDHFLRLAASAESVSEHPLGQAIVEAAKAQGLALSEPQEFQAVAGGGFGPRWMDSACWWERAGC